MKLYLWDIIILILCIAACVFMPLAVYYPTYSQAFGWTAFGCSAAAIVAECIDIGSEKKTAIKAFE